MKNLISFFILWGFHAVSFYLLCAVLWNVLGCKCVGVSCGISMIIEKIVFFAIALVLSVFEIYIVKKAKIVLVVFSVIFSFRFGVEMIGDIQRIYCVLYFSEIIGLWIPYFIYKRRIRS